MTAIRDRLIIDLNDTLDRAKLHAKKEYTFIHGHMLEFTYDVTEAFEAEPTLLEDDEVKKLLVETIDSLKPYVRELLSDYSALEMTFVCARHDFDYNPQYYWLWLPEKVMTDEQLRRWNKYKRKQGYEI